MHPLPPLRLANQECDRNRACIVGTVDGAFPVPPVPTGEHPPPPPHSRHASIARTPVCGWGWSMPPGSLEGALAVAAVLFKTVHSHTQPRSAREKGGSAHAHQGWPLYQGHSFTCGARCAAFVLLGGHAPSGLGIQQLSSLISIWHPPLFPWLPAWCTARHIHSAWLLGLCTRAQGGQGRAGGEEQAPEDGQRHVPPRAEDDQLSVAA